MTVKEINTYLQRAREIIGERSPSEIAYDDCVLAHLCTGVDIRGAVRAANRQHPDEALTPGQEHWDDLASRYDYLREHKNILKRLGIRE